METVVTKEKKKIQAKKSESPRERAFSFTIVYDKIPNNYDAFVNAELDKISYEMLEAGSSEALTILLGLHEKYPNIPEVINDIMACYHVQGKIDKAEEFLEKLYQSCPDYLLVRIIRATNAINENRAEEVPLIFNNCFNLKDFYPERDVFHVSEVVDFSHIMCSYYCAINDLKMAQIHFDIFAELVDKDDSRIEQLTFAMIMNRMLSFAGKMKPRDMQKRKAKKMAKE